MSAWAEPITTLMSLFGEPEMEFSEEEYAQSLADNEWELCPWCGQEVSPVEEYRCFNPDCPGEEYFDDIDDLEEDLDLEEEDWT